MQLYPTLSGLLLHPSALRYKEAHPFFRKVNIVKRVAQVPDALFLIGVCAGLVGTIVTLAATRFQEKIDGDGAEATRKKELKVVNDREDRRLVLEKSCFVLIEKRCFSRESLWRYEDRI